jgi:hypothetical protein
MPDDLQPDSGQGDAGTGIFDSYLQNVPEEHREIVGSYLKDAEKNVNGRLEEAATLKSTWEPYQEVEQLTQYDPKELAELLAWHEQVKQEDGYQRFVAEAAKELGLIEAQEQVEEAENPNADIEALIAAQAQAQVAPIQEKIQEWETERAIDTEDQNIKTELSRLEEESGVTLSKDQKAMVLDLGINHEGQGSWVQVGFDRFRSMTAEAQKAFVQDKTTQPAVPLAAGGGSERLKPTTTFEQAAARTKERLRQSQS